MKIPVLLPNIFDHPFTYESDKKVEVGRYVLVPSDCCMWGQEVFRFQR